MKRQYKKKSVKKVKSKKLETIVEDVFLEDVSIEDRINSDDRKVQERAGNYKQKNCEIIVEILKKNSME